MDKNKGEEHTRNYISMMYTYFLITPPVIDIVLRKTDFETIVVSISLIIFGLGILVKSWKLVHLGCARRSYIILIIALMLLQLTYIAFANNAYNLGFIAMYILAPLLVVFTLRNKLSIINNTVS